MQKKVVMYVYGDITTDARVNRAANALANDFDVCLISTNCGKVIKDNNVKNVLVGNIGTGIKSLFRCIYDAYKVIKEEKPDIVYCHDYYSSLLAYLLLSKRHCKRIIYDAHELIIPEPSVKDYRLSFFRWFERKIIKRVDLVICASEERGQLMQKYYSLDKSPLPIRNISQLSISEDDETKNILSKLDVFLSIDMPTVVYAGVVTKSRRIIELEKAVATLNAKYKLLVVGAGDALDEVKESALNDGIQFAYTGKIPYKSLGAVLNKCDIGFVYYPTNTLNNTYCASNKVYEYASVSLPMISNNNPTIREELKKNHIGVSSDNLVDALLEVYKDISVYKQSCLDYTEANPWENEASLLLSKVCELC